MRRFAAYGLVLVATLIAACGGGDGGGAPAAPTLTAIRIAPATADLGVGMSTSLTATGLYSDASTADLTASVTWTALDPGIAQVTSAGVLTGVSRGAAEVSAGLGSVQARVPVNVRSQQWTLTGSLPTGLTSGPTPAVLLKDGRVLMLGGVAAQVYAPATGRWSVVRPMPAGFQFPVQVAGAVTLLDGRVLVTFGVSSAAALLYDPAADTWTATADAPDAVDAPMVRLADGRVLMAGGVAGALPVAGSRIYDPASGTWRLSGNLGAPRAFHTLTLLANGQVLAAGGAVISDARVVAAAEVYDPSTGRWSPAGSLPRPVYDHTATRLPNGEVLIAGGYETFGSGVASPVAQRYDPVTGAWSTTGSLLQARIGHGAVLLADGQVLVAGGSQAGQTLATAERYDPVGGVWSATDSLSAARSGFSLVPLQDRTVLATGGLLRGGAPLLSTELYWP